jgi:hypothetical protein
LTDVVTAFANLQTNDQIIQLYQGGYVEQVVAGLLSRLFLGFFVNPILYELVAREGDVLQV